MHKEKEKNLRKKNGFYTERAKTKAKNATKHWIKE